MECAKQFGFLHDSKWRGLIRTNRTFDGDVAWASLLFGMARDVFDPL